MAFVELDGEQSFKDGDRIIVPAGFKQRHTNTGKEPIVLLCICQPAFFDSAYTEIENTIIDHAFAERAKGIVATIPYFGPEPNDSFLKAKTAVATGGDRGTGKEICRQLGRMGCHGTLQRLKQLYRI